MSTSYTLKLFPVSDASREMYVKHMGGLELNYPNNDNAGFDLLLSENYQYDGGHFPQFMLAKLGVKAIMLNNVTGQTVHFWLAPRSSIWKNGLILANSMGVIDRTYRGELMAALQRLTDVTHKTGLRLVQVLAPDMGHISRVCICTDDELDQTVRGDGGFGSTGA